MRKISTVTFELHLFCTVLACSWHELTYQNAEPAGEEYPVLRPVGLGAPRLLVVLVVVVLGVVVVRLVLRRGVGVRLLVYDNLLRRVLCRRDLRRQSRKRVAWNKG